MEAFFIIAIAASWFWVGRTWRPKPAPKQKSSGDVLEGKLWDQMAGLKSNMRFVGECEGLSAKVSSEWVFDKLGPVKITLEPLPDTPNLPRTAPPDAKTPAR